MLKRNKSVVHCLGSKNMTESSTGLSSVLLKRSTMVNVDHGVTVIDAASLDFPNGKSQAAEIAVKDMVPCSGPPISAVDMRDGIGIIRFLKEKKFLITGATGFLAKVLIEKILRTTPDVGKIFLVIKAKDEEAATERLKNEIINTELFTYLQQTYGKSYQSFMLSKLVPVVGDVCKSNIGLEEDTADVIAREVDVIIHSAANTTFDERYDVALDINTKGPGRLMSFAKKCKKLKLFMQVSTAYVNGQRQGRIMEKPFCMGDSIARERLMFETSQSFVPALDLEGHQLHGWQDTYVFTKAMGEMVIDDMKGEIPVVIIRPSVVESTYKDPFPGWIEGNRMMDPVIQLYGKGQITGFLMDPNGVLDVVPVDMVVNAMLAAIAKHGVHGKSGTNVYQVGSSTVNPLVFRDLTRSFYEHFHSLPCLDSKGRPINLPDMMHFSSMDDFSSNVLGNALRRCGQTSMANQNEMSRKLEVFCRKSVELATHLASIYEPYTFYGGRFDSSNTQGLMECMSEKERKEFGIDLESIDWKDYISNIHIPGLRRHVMKDRATRTKFPASSHMGSEEPVIL
ncbi:hypothetical protein F0562_017227 [Nyssa sinensis]|uniref:Fatty acyl-CoA reductase n=1 Tax=Nyssa sinensis TaxID=561372 RepID=A0A5J4ZEL0_9ASTE|nr:hypothetical protein F0562_017227 [Nyssa sinensis]